MDELQKVFNYENSEVRMVIKCGEPWFVAKDICDILEISNGRDALYRLDEDEISDVVLNDGSQNRTYGIVSESGLYSLILGSRKPEAKQFKRWITHEVIPSIRKTGGYVNNDELFINTYLQFADDSTKAMFRNTLQVVRIQNETIQKQKKEIEYKEGVIIGLVDEVGLAEKRQVLNRVVRHNNANYQERWKELYRQFEMKYHIDLSQRFESYNSSHKPKLKNKLDYIDRVMNKIPELYEIACKLYENDIKELMEEMYSLNVGA